MEPAEAKIRFNGIEIISKNLTQRPLDQVKNEPPSEFQFDILAASQVNPTVKVVIITVDINIKENETKINYFSIKVICVFEIENFDEIIEKISDDRYLIPPAIDAMMKSISVSTTRGIIYTETTGTFLYKVVLPVVFFTPEQIKEQQDKELKA